MKQHQVPTNDEFMVGVIVGLALAGFGPHLGGGLYYLLRGGSPGDWQTVVAFGLLTYPVAVTLAAALGFPMFLLAWRFGVTGWWCAVIVGALVGYLVQSVLFNARLTVENLLLSAAEGSATGLLFYLGWNLGIRGRRRHQRTDVV